MAVSMADAALTAAASGQQKRRLPPRALKGATFAGLGAGLVRLGAGLGQPLGLLAARGPTAASENRDGESVDATVANATVANATVAMAS